MTTDRQQRPAFIVMHLKDADGMANSVDPDKEQSDLSLHCLPTVRKLRIIMERSLRSQWATSRKNVTLRIFDKVRFKPACSATETC